MTLTDLAGIGGLGFVLIAVIVNIVYIRGGLPLPSSGRGLAATIEDYASVGTALQRPSVLAPATWLMLTVFAAGLVAELWNDSSQTTAWALVGLGGVLLQNATFASVEALRFALAEAATRARDSVAGFWVLSNVLFGFNQVFLATALLGFTAAGAGTDLIPVWHVALGYASAALLFLSSSTTPYNTTGANRIGLVGLVGWLGWISWIVAYSITLIRL